MKYLVVLAPINASQQLLMNQHRTIDGGTLLCSSAAKWAGKAARNKSHHVLTGVSKSAASRIEFGGHSTETG